MSDTLDYTPDHPHGLRCGTPGGRCGPPLDEDDSTVDLDTERERRRHATTDGTMETCSPPPKQPPH